MRIPFKKKVLFAVIGTIILAVLFLFAAELFLRLYIHLRYGVRGKTYGIYMADKELGSIHRPNSYNLNSVIDNWGFRNTENILEQKPKGALRIYCSGGSTVFCYNLPTEESWPSVLQCKLRRIQGHERDEVLNAGEICFAVSHEFILAKRLIPVLKPDIVILYSLGTNEGLEEYALRREGNDLNQLLAERKWGIVTRELNQVSLLSRKSVLVKLFDYKIKTLFESKLTKVFRNKTATAAISNFNSYPHRWTIENFDYTLQAYLDFLRNNGCKVIIVRYSDNGFKNWYMDNFIRMFRDRAVAIGKENGAIISDIASVVEQDPKRKQLYSHTVLHVTKEGAELVADTLLNTIKNNERYLQAP